MGALVNLLLDSTTVDGVVIGEATESSFASQLLSVLSIIMIIADAALVVFAVYMFFMMMTASTEEKRRNVKKHFFNTLSSIFIILALIGTLSVINVNISTVKKEGTTGSGGGSGGSSTSMPEMFEGYTIYQKEMVITHYQSDANPGQFYVQGTLNFTADLIRLQDGAKVFSITDFVVTSGQDFASSNFKSRSLSNTNKQIVVDYTKYIDASKNTLYTGNPQGVSGQKPYFEYKVYVSAEDKEGNSASYYLTGKVTLKSFDTNVLKII